MESRRMRGFAVMLLGALLVVSVVGGVSAVERRGQDAAATIQESKDVLSQVWEVAGPWVQWAKSAARDIFAIVYEKASLQGLRSVCTEAGRIGLDFFSGRPYQAAYKVAKDVPVAGRAVKEVTGEANLRKKAAAEHADDKEL